MTREPIIRSLAAALLAYRDLSRDIAVSEAIKAITGYDVIPLDLLSNDDRNMLAALTQACQECITTTRLNPIVSGRVNEVGNLFEPVVMTACRNAGLRATPPPGAGPSGYPDLLIFDAANRPTYVEVKAVGPGQENSSFRSFYLSPSDNPKVRSDGRHMLVAFSHESVRLQNGSTGYFANAFKIVDLAQVNGQIKFEYQTSNKKLYRELGVIAQG